MKKKILGMLIIVMMVSLVMGCGKTESVTNEEETIVYENKHKENNVEEENVEDDVVAELTMADKLEQSPAAEYEDCRLRWIYCYLMYCREEQGLSDVGFENLSETEFKTWLESKYNCEGVKEWLEANAYKDGINNDGIGKMFDEIGNWEERDNIGWIFSFFFGDDQWYTDGFVNYDGDNYYVIDKLEDASLTIISERIEAIEYFNWNHSKLKAFDLNVDYEFNTTTPSAAYQYSCWPELAFVPEGSPEGFRYPEPQ